MLLAVLTSIISIVAAKIGANSVVSSEKLKTARKTLYQSYIPIYKLLEYKMFQDIPFEECVELCKQVIEIFDASDYHYYPSLKIYAEFVVDSDANTYLDDWKYFCKRFNREYDKYSRLLKLPKRSRSYRINRKQYEDDYHFFRIYFWNTEGLIEFSLYFFLLVLAFLLSYYS